VRYDIFNKLENEEGMEMKKLTIVTVVIAVVCISVLSTFGTPAKEREWQEGKLIDISSAPFTEGTIGGLAHKEKIIYVIDAGKYIYTFSHLHFPHDKAMPVTVNSVVKFAIEKNKVYILDEDGKEHDLKFEKKSLKDAAKDR
jgi:hypothetical protein